MIDLASLAIAIDSTQVKGASDKLDDLTKAGGRAEGATNNLTLSSLKLSSVLKTIAGLWAAQQIASYIKEATLLNARHETLGIVMGVVGQQAGYNKTQMDGYTDALRAQGITMVEARQTVISMAQAEIDLAQASKLARVAQDAAVIGGINSSEALNRMVYGIKSAQVEVLRTIGLNVNFEASYQKLAAQINKKVDALTEGEKAQARANAAMEAGTLIAGSYEAAMTTAGKQLTSLARYEEDLKVIIGEVFNDALVVAVEGYTSALKGATAEAKALSAAGDFREWGNTVVYSLAVVADAAYVVSAAFKKVGGDIGAFFAAATPGTSWDAVWAARDEEVAGLVAGLGKYQKAAEERIEVMEKERAAQAEVTAMLKEHSNTADTDVVPKLKRLDDLMFESAINVQTYNDAVRTLTGTWAKAGTSVGMATDQELKFIQALKDEVAVLGMSDAQKKVWAASNQGFTDSGKKVVASLAAQMEAHKLTIKILEDAARENDNLERATAARVEAEAKLASQAAAIRASMSTDVAAQAQYQYDAIKLSVDGQLAELARLNGVSVELITESTTGITDLLSAANEQRILNSRTASEKMLSDWSNAQLNLSNASTSWLTSFSEGLTDLVMTGKASFRDFANSVIRDIARIIIQQRIAGIVGSVTSGLFGTGGDGTYSTPPTDGILTRAHGGPVEAGQPYWVGERGEPELFIPTSSGTVVPRNQVGSQQAITVTNIYQISTGVSETVRAEIMAIAPIIEARSKQGVLTAIERGGSYARAVGRKQ